MPGSEDSRKKVKILRSTRSSARLNSRQTKESNQQNHCANVTGKENISSNSNRKRKAEEAFSNNSELNKRRQQFQKENNWAPIRESQSTVHNVSPVDSPVNTPFVVLPSPDTTPKPVEESVTVTFSRLQFKNLLCNFHADNSSPLPTLDWADSHELWNLMKVKESLYVRKGDSILLQHPELKSNMRSILLDWIIEVCEVYKLHRETFVLSTDFLDRYLSETKNVKKLQLQLIGITALFIASKLEEIYPPKLSEFAYVTDGACTEDEILQQELVMLKALRWDLAPMTTNMWLNIYLQLVNLEGSSDDSEQNFVHPQYSPHAFIQIARLLDLCLLDKGSLNFPYSILTSTALYHLSSEHIVEKVSGYKWQDIASCVEWMAPFADAVRQIEPAELKLFPQVPNDMCHNIQTHCISLDLLEIAQAKQNQILLALRQSPECVNEVSTGLITPPQSKEKNKCKSTSNSLSPTPSTVQAASSSSVLSSP